MWKRNLLFCVTCLVGAVSLGGALLRTNRMRQPLAFDPARLQREDMGDIVRQVNQDFRDQWERNDLQQAPPADSLVIARRLALGLTGTIPSLEEIRHLETLPPDQRSEWFLSRLLEDRRYADYVAERLARAYVGTEDGPFIVYRRRRFVRWLSDQLHENVSYDQLVRQLIEATGIWTSAPEVNFLTVTIDQEDGGRPDPVRLAGRTSRAMLGMRIDCLQCHDDNLGNIELGESDQRHGGTQADFHQLAAFYSEPHVSLLGISDEENDYRYQFLHAQDEKTIPPLPPFGTELLTAQGNRREQLARWVTHPDNRPFARAIVNRVWALMFGRPLVNPIDDIPLYGRMPPALDTLATDFTQHDCDIQRLIRVIAATEVFQLSSRADFEITQRHEANWAVFPLTRLRPEQVAGATIQSAALKTIDAETHIVFRLARFGDESQFVSRYGDVGDDEFDDRGGTVTQRLLMMNGELVKGKTRENPFVNAATRIAQLAPNDETAVQTAYLCTLSRGPSEEERKHFVGKLREARGKRRNACLEDICWTLLNSTEFSWNH